jgi:hypothetical protein
MTTRDYDLHARGVAQSIGLTVTIRRATGNVCPPWSKPCDHKHGHRYMVTLTKPGRDPLTFPFWDSMHNAATGTAPTVYDVLACISSDASGPTDPDEVAEEYGPMRPSQAIAAAEFARKLQAFFTRAERERLAEVS